MSEPIISDLDALDEFIDRMTTTEADELLGVRHGTIGAATRRGEIVPYYLPGGKQPFYSKRMLAQWVKKYCTGGAA